MHSQLLRYLCVVTQPGTPLYLESVLVMRLQSRQKCVYHLANYLSCLPHPHRNREGSSKGHRAHRLPQGRISYIYNIPNRCLSGLFLKPSNVEIFQAPHAALNSPCKFLMILGILSSSITTSHIPPLNSTCLSACSKALHSSGSICPWFFMRVSSQGVWVLCPLTD